MKGIYFIFMVVYLLTSFSSSWALDPMLQNPVITDTDLKVGVSFDVSTGIYTYTYTVVSGPTNLGEIDGFAVDITTTSPQETVIDPDLINDQSRIDVQLPQFFDVPKNIVPVSLKSPPQWLSAVTVLGQADWGSTEESNDIFPGQTLSGFIIQAKAPPGPRRFGISPFFDTVGFPEDCEIRPDCPKPEDFNVSGQTIGPVLADELVLIDGKGQRPSDVNTFLKYSNPTKTRATLPAGVKKFDLVVFYGPTIIPATFSASLNGVIITPKFNVTPGGVSVVRLDLANGNNTLILSVEGIRSNGRKGRDTDRLTLIVPTP